MWCRCITWATLVRLWISQVTVVPSFGKASAWAGLKVLPLISQVGLEEAADRDLPAVVGLAAWPSAVHAGSGRSRRGTRVRSATPLAADPELHQRAGVGAGAVGVAAAVAVAAAQLDRLAAGAGEVDDHLGPLGRAEQDFACAAPAPASGRCRSRSGPSGRRWRGAGCSCGRARR